MTFSLKNIKLTSYEYNLSILERQILQKTHLNMPSRSRNSHSFLLSQIRDELIDVDFTKTNKATNVIVCWLIYNYNSPIFSFIYKIFVLKYDDLSGQRTIKPIKNFQFQLYFIFLKYTIMMEGQNIMILKWDLIL